MPRRQVAKYEPLQACSVPIHGAARRDQFAPFAQHPETARRNLRDEAQNMQDDQAAKRLITAIVLGQLEITILTA